MSDPMHQLFEAIGRIEAKLDGQQEDISEIKATVTSHEQIKNRVIGWCVGVSAATGASVSAVLNKLGIHI